MAFRKYIYGLVAALLWGDTALARDGKASLMVKDKRVERMGDELRVSMCVVLDSLRQVIINGRDRHVLYQRLERGATDALELRRRDGEPQAVDYEAAVPYAAWMERSVLALVTDDCGCGWEALASRRAELLDIDLRPVVLTPRVVYVTPVAEAVKSRQLGGSAFLDFPVNRVEIHPDYRNNPAELAKIRATIEAALGNKFATITALSIKGYASPEGAYRANARLAEERARALLEYVRGRYDLGDARLRVEYEPEDWAGLERAVEASDLADKAELLAIIRADEPADWDAREARLKALNGGASYRWLLREVYPALRHSDYEVDYTIRDFNDEEAAELAFTDPAQLSLNELFRVAARLEPGSERYNEVFEIAVRMYPDDPVSNLNAAINAIQTGRFERARAYLAKAADGPEKRLAEAALAMREDDLDRAEALLRPLVDDARVGAAASDNLGQIQAKRRKEGR